MLYHEVHVTLEPITGDAAVERLRSLAAAYRFRLADLILRKGGGRHEDDIFLTTRTVEPGARAKAEALTREFVAALRSAGHTVRRYKIEDTVVDSNVEDVLGILGETVRPTVMVEDD